MTPHLPTAPKSLRVALCVAQRVEDGLTTERAIREAAEALGVSESAIIAAVQKWQDAN